jgi:hypothetical protein
LASRIHALPRSGLRVAAVEDGEGEEEGGEARMEGEDGEGEGERAAGR